MWSQTALIVHGDQWQPGEAVAICAEVGVRCVLFGGRVEDGVEALPLSGDPSRAVVDLEELGLSLGGA